MKSAFLFSLLVLMGVLFVQCAGDANENADDDIRIYLVRHAEKQGGADPDLSTIGKARADSLKRLLQNNDLCRIFSTDYKRTRNTAQPLANQFNLPVNLYIPLDKSFATYLKDTLDCSALVVGHSNTIPGLVNAIIDSHKYSDLTEFEYDKLFILTKKGNTFEDQVVIF